MNRFLFSKIGTLIPAGQSRADTLKQFQGYLEQAGWVTLESVTTVSDPYLTVRPPSSEKLGNARGYEGVRLHFRPNDVLMRPVFVPSENSPQSYYLFSPYYNYNRAVKIGDSVFSFPPGPNENDAVQAVFEALSTSASPDAQRFTYTIVDLGDGQKRVLARQKTVGDGAKILDGGYMYVREASMETVAGVPVDRGASMSNNSVSTLPVDYGQSWVLYLGITTRSIIMGSRTMTGFYGPYAATYLRNEDAQAQCTGDTAVAELAMARMQESGAWPIRFQFAYGYASKSSYDLSDLSTSSSNTYSVRPSNGSLAHPFHPLSVGTHVMRAYNYEPSSYGRPGNTDMDRTQFKRIFGGDRALTMISVTCRSEINYSAGNIVLAVWSPSANLEDLHQYLIDDSSETAHVVRASERGLLTAALDASATVMTLDSTAAFPDAGTVIIDGEVLTYAAKTQNTLTGLKRGINGTLAAPHTVTSPAYVGMWFLKINAGAIPTGYSPPGA